MIQQHTDREYESELILLREKVLLMGAKVEAMIRSAVKAFERQDMEMAQRTIEVDHDINRLEVDIDGYCLSLLARRQPVASDLRFIATVFKVVTDLERMGDLAVNICERVVDCGLDAHAQPWPEIADMADLVQSMIRDALDAFLSKDDAKARWVIERDRSVDVIYAKLFHQILLVMLGDAVYIHRGMSVQAIAKYLERIGDHATNLAEMVVFLAKGQDIRHHASMATEA